VDSAQPAAFAALADISPARMIQLYRNMSFSVPDYLASEFPRLMIPKEEKVFRTP
jgi:hypothetical protein